MKKNTCFKKFLSIFLTSVMVLSTINFTVQNVYASSDDLDYMSKLPAVGALDMSPLPSHAALQAPPIATSESKIVLVWDKPSNYEKYTDYAVYLNGVKLPRTSKEQFKITYPTTSSYMDAFYEKSASIYQHQPITYHTYTVTDLTADTQYNFEVKGITANGEESLTGYTITAKTTPVAKIFNVQDFGAKSVETAFGATAASVLLTLQSYDSGKTPDQQAYMQYETFTKENTSAMQAAIDACTPGGKVVVPPGTFVTGALWLKSDMTLEVQKGGKILGSPISTQYPAGHILYNYSQDIRSFSLINAHTYDTGTLQNIRIVGEGIIDGNGWKRGSGSTVTTDKNQNVDSLDPTGTTLPQYVGGGSGVVNVQGILVADVCKRAQADGYTESDAYAMRPNLIHLRGVKNVYYEGFTAANPANHGIVNLQCEDIVVNGTVSKTYDCNNGDGVEFGDSENAMIFGNFFDTGDDAINFAAGLGAESQKETPCENFWTFNNFLRETHGGSIAAGSHTGAFIQNLLVEDNVHNRSQMPFRFKANPVNGGGVRYVLIRDNAIHNPLNNQTFILTSDYTDANQATTVEPAEGMPAFSYIYVKNVSVYNASNAPNKTTGIQTVSGDGGLWQNWHTSKNVTFDNVRYSINKSDSVYSNINNLENSIFNNVTLDGANTNAKWNILNSKGLQFTGNTTSTAVSINASEAPIWPTAPTLSKYITTNDAVYFGLNLDKLATDKTKVTKYTVSMSVYDEKVNQISYSSATELTGKIAIANLAPGQEYTFKVEAEDATGNRTTTGPSGSFVTAGTPKTVEGSVYQIAPPTVTGEISANGAPGFTWASVKWNAPAATEYVNRYEIKAVPIGGGETVTKTLVNNIRGISTGGTLKGLKPGTTYTISVSAISDYNVKQAYSNTIPITTMAPFSTSVPQWSNASLTESKIIRDNKSDIAIAWPQAIDTITAPDTTITGSLGIDGYRVYVDNKAMTSNEKVWTPVNGENTTTGTAYTVNGVDNDEFYFIKVEASNKWNKLLPKNNKAQTLTSYRWSGSGPSKIIFAGSPKINKDLGTDYSAKLSPYAPALKSIASTSATLTEGTDYTITNNVLTIKAAAFSKFAGKVANLIFTFANAESVVVPFELTSGDASGLVWKSITFGQSTDLDFSSNVLPEKVGTNYVQAENPGTINGNIVLESRGGKITAGHDGMTFYYTVLDPKTTNFELSADILVNQFGPETAANPSGQESAGIMVRDIIGPPRQEPKVAGFEELVSSSNYASTLVFRNGSSVKDKINVTSSVRNGVTDPWGTTGSKQVNTTLASAVPIATSFKMKLERTDSGFITTYISNDGKTTKTDTITGADIVQRLDPDNMYVGFFVARNAKITVSNASITLSKANTVATAPLVPVRDAVAFNIISATKYSNEDYILSAQSNYAGKVSVTKDGTNIVTDATVNAVTPYELPTKLTNDTTVFTMTFTPTDSNAPSNTAITKNVTVTKNSKYGSDKLFASPNGRDTAAGTLEDPLSLTAAISYIIPGGTIYMLGGNYQAITIAKEFRGYANKLKTLVPYDNAKVIFKGTILLAADYWHIKGIEVGDTVLSSTGMRVTGNYNIIEDVAFHHNIDSGFQLGNGTGTIPEWWPSYNQIINCESYNNQDASLINADGFAAKLGVGPGNIFTGCISHDNIDDGWDLYNKIEGTGANMPVTIENCIAYNNTSNGFKLGGEGIPVKHVIKKSLAYKNGMAGFTCNFNPGVITVENCTAFDNVKNNYIFRTSPYFTPEQQGIFTNNISYRTDGSATAGDYVSGNLDATDFFYNTEAKKSVNSLGLAVSTGDFISTTPPTTYTRDELQNIVWGDFLRLTSSSALNTAGKNGSYVGAIPSKLVVSNIQSITGLANKTVENGTLMSQIGLPEKVSVILVGGISKELPVTWTTTTYNANVAGTYTFIGTFILPADGSITNSGNLTATVNVIVNPLVIIGGGGGSGGHGLGSGESTTTTQGNTVKEPTTKIPTPNEPTVVSVLPNVATTKVGETTTINMTVDSSNILNAVNSGADIVSIPLTALNGATSVTAILSAETINTLSSKNTRIEVNTPLGVYLLDCDKINVIAAANKLGNDIALGGIQVKINIAVTPKEMADVTSQAIKNGNLELIVPAIDFKVTFSNNSKEVELKNYSSFIERRIQIPSAIDVNKITTAVVVKENGQLKPVPTKVKNIDGNHYVVIKSVTNSTYALIYNQKSFSDMNNHWAATAANALGSKLIVEGSGNNKFEPNKDASRAEFVTMISKAMGLSVDTAEISNSFKDVTNKNWYYESVMAAKEYQIVKGDEKDNFNGTKTISRQEAIVMISRLLSLASFDTNISDSEVNQIIDSFKDGNQVASWAKKDVAICIKYGFVNGSDGKILTTQNITKAQIATLLYNLLKGTDLS